MVVKVVYIGLRRGPGAAHMRPSLVDFAGVIRLELGAGRRYISEQALSLFHQLDTVQLDPVLDVRLVVILRINLQLNILTTRATRGTPARSDDDAPPAGRDQSECPYPFQPQRMSCRSALASRQSRHVVALLESSAGRLG